MLLEQNRYPKESENFSIGGKFKNHYILLTKKKKKKHLLPKEGKWLI